MTISTNILEVLVFVHLQNHGLAARIPVPYQVLQNQHHKYQDQGQTSKDQDLQKLVVNDLSWSD